MLLEISVKPLKSLWRSFFPHKIIVGRLANNKEFLQRENSRYLIWHLCEKMFFEMLSNGCAWTLSLGVLLWSLKCKQHIKTYRPLLKLSFCYKSKESTNRTQFFIKSSWNSFCIGIKIIYSLENRENPLCFFLGLHFFLFR